MSDAGGANAQRMVSYIKCLPYLKMYSQIDGNYNHVGATLADAVLQSNNNYERNVRPRIAHIRKVHQEATGLQDLKRILETITPQEFLHWNGTRKPATFMDLVGLLGNVGVESEGDLRKWLQQGSSRAQLLNIRFIGPKTADYLKILVGLPTAAIDRHLLKFLENAGLGHLTYAQSQEIVHQAADLMGLDRARLDHSIWRYMSGDKTDPEKTKICVI